jgi:hypothetical protein
MRRLLNKLPQVRLPLPLKARLEGALLRVAAYIVYDRNVARSPVVSRRDNNLMFEMGYDLKAIAKRIEQGYPDADY